VEKKFHCEYWEIPHTLSWLMKAFPDNGSPSGQQKTFNYRLSRARVVVEHAMDGLRGAGGVYLKEIIHQYMT
jgi:hypothetical protein